MSYIIMGIVGVLVITCGLFAYQYMKPGDSDSKGEVTYHCKQKGGSKKRFY